MNEPLAQRSPLPGARLPAGRLTLEPVIAALLADGLLAPKDAEHARASARHVRGLDAVHPLVGGTSRYEPLKKITNSTEKLI